MASGGWIPARVIESGPGTLLIAITVPIRPLTGGELAGMVLEFTAPNGRVRLQGEITMDNPADPDMLRIEAPRAVEVIQDREYVRIDVARPVNVRSRREQLEVETYTVDVSGGGMLLAGPDTLRIGDEVQFDLALAAEERPVSGVGTVVRVDTRAGARSRSTRSATSIAGA